MESIHVRQRLRPVRYAFIINQGDLESALTAVSVNTALWGGIYNPIVPLAPEAERDSLLAEFDPDEIVDLTGGRIHPTILERFALRIVTPDHFVTTDRRGEKRLRFGFDVLPIVRRIYESEVRYSTAATRVALVRTDVGDGWSEYLAFIFGSFARLPELDTDFGAIFARALRARTVLFDPAKITDELRDIVAPITLTRNGIRVLGSRAGLSSHVIYIGDHRSWFDLIAFWNIRAAGHTALFVPVAVHQGYASLIRTTAEAGRYFINPQLANEPDLVKAPSLTEVHFDQVCEWISTLDAGAARRRRSPPIHASELEAQSCVEISILQESSMTPVKLISPEYFEDDPAFFGEYTWAIDITLSGGGFDNQYAFAFPYEPAMQRLIPRGFIGGSPAPRLGRHGVVTLQQSPQGNLHLLPIQTQDVFTAVFAEVGLEMEPSQPGRYANEIIKKMGHLHPDCRVFKLQGVRAVLDRLSRGGVLTKGNMHDIAMSPQHWQGALYEEIVVRAGQHGKLNFTHIFDVLLEKRVIRPGFTLRCQTCFGEDWYHVSEFDEEYTCRFCFASQRVNFGSVHDWQYKADGLFQIRDSALGSLAVIVSLWRFAEFHSLGASRYQTSVNLRDPKTRWSCEVDYAYLQVGLFDTSYELVIGQAAGAIDFTENDMANMSALADRFGMRPWLAFSTLKEAFSDDEKRQFKRLIERHYRIIALTRLELDPYHLYERFDSAPHKYAVSLGDLSANTMHLNLR